MIEIVHELRRASGRNAKKDILLRHVDNILWKKILVAMYDDSINYYIGAPKEYTFLQTDIDHLSMFEDLVTLRRRYVVGTEAKKFVTKKSQQYGEIFRLILRGTLDAGVSIKTINSVYPGLIPTFPLMLANKKSPSTYPVLVSTKFDGVRIVVIVQDNVASVYTRSGKVLNIKSLKLKMARKPDGVYDGELVAGSGLQVGRTKITGEVNKVLKGSKTDIDGYSFMIFDYISIRDWITQTSITPYIHRLRTLHNMDFIDTSVKVIPEDYVDSAHGVTVLFSERIAKGYEGLILRYPDTPYIWGRTDLLMKVKSIHTAVLDCVNVEEGTGKYEGLIGSLVCAGTVDGRPVSVKVGTGLSDFDREEPVESYLGQFIEVEYNDMVKAKNSDVWSLFLPVFKRIKTNKDI